MKYCPPLSDQSLLSLRFALPPILAIAAGKLLFELLAFDFPQLGDSLAAYFSAMRVNLPPATSLLEAKARLLWLTSALLYLCLSAGYFAFLGGSLKKTAAGNLWQPICIVSLLSCCEILYLWLADSAHSPIKTLFYFTADALTASMLLSPKYLAIVQYTLLLINLFSIVIAPLAIVTSCCLICPQTSDIDQLSLRFRWLKKMVESASAVMITGIIHMQLWLSWPLNLIPDFANIKELKEIVMTVIQYWGICYSLTIAALYLPSATYLRNRALSILHNSNARDPSVKLPSWLDESQGMTSISEKIPQIAAILAPMVVGSISPAMSELFTF